MPNSIRFDGGRPVLVHDPVYRDEAKSEQLVITLAPYLGCPVTLETETTFRHVWNYIAYKPDFMGVVFREALGGFDLKPFVEESSQDMENENQTKDGMKELVLSWEGKIWDGNLEIYTVFKGRGDWIDEKGEVHPDTGFALEFTPINELLNYPLRLDPSLEIIEQRKTKRRQPTERITIWKGTKEWTVYDMIYGILDEISFFGTPTHRAAELAEIDQRMAEIKDGTAKLIPWEEVKKELDINDEEQDESESEE